MPKWLTYSLLAIALWGAWGLINVPVGKALDPFPLQVVSTLGVVLLIPAMLLSKNLKTGKNFGRGIAWAFATGLFGSLGNVAITASLAAGGQVSIVLPLTSLYPLVTAALAWVVLKERLNGIQFIGLGLALAALFLSGLVSAGEPAGQAEPGASGWRKAVSPWMLYALATMVCYGVAAVFQKLSTHDISNELSTVFFALAFVAIAAVILATSRSFSWKLPAATWLLALSYGALIGVGTLTLFAAYRWGKASVVTAVTALYPALTVVLAVPVFGERLDTLKVVMIVLALGAGVALTYEKKTVEKPAAP